MEEAVIKINDFLAIVSGLPYIYLVIIAFGLTLSENIFPPAPSDVCFVVITGLVGFNEELMIPVILSASLGAIIGFWIMYILGLKFEKKIVESNKIKFISKTSIEKAEKMFQKWGIKIVAINRFMSGTRAVISFFAGMSALPKTKTLIYAGISSLLYYGLLAMVGYYFGKDYPRILEFLHTYEKITFAIVIFIIIIGIAIWLIKRQIKK